MSRAGILVPPGAHRFVARAPAEPESAPSGRTISIVFSDLDVRWVHQE